MGTTNAMGNWFLRIGKSLATALGKWLLNHASTPGNHESTRCELKLADHAQAIFNSFYLQVKEGNTVAGRHYQAITKDAEITITDYTLLLDELLVAVCIAEELFSQGVFNRGDCFGFRNRAHTALAKIQELQPDYFRLPDLHGLCEEAFLVQFP
ncbi:MAG TPA: hypothetical protein VMW23_02195 [Sedimentisphaerales bacterium]|nr:hypothetical protein [Sedimentisphaerales bacterium]